MFFATQLWRNRRLIWRLALTQLRDRYASTAIGSLWAVLQPILVMLVFWFVFTYALRQGTPTDGAPFVLFLIIGLGVWFALSDALLNGANAVTQNAYLITKIAFPVELLPVVPVVVALIVHAAMMLIIVALMIAMGSPPSVDAVEVLFYGAAMFGCWRPGYRVSAVRDQCFLSRYGTIAGSGAAGLVLDHPYRLVAGYIF